MRSSRPSAGLVLLLCCALVAQTTAEPAVESQVEANEEGEVATDGTTGPADPEAAADESVRFDYGRTDPEPLSMGSYSPATGGSKGDCAVLCQWEDYTPVCNANGRRVAQSACEARCVGLFSNQYSSAWCGVPKSGGGWFSGRKLRAFHA